MARHDDSKPSVGLVEEAPTQKHYIGEEIIALPPLLEGSSDDELKKLGRRATLKLDVIIMPAMTMYESLDGLTQVKPQLMCQQKLHSQLS